jgi:hypothetical protein
MQNSALEKLLVVDYMVENTGWQVETVTNKTS